MTTLILHSWRSVTKPSHFTNGVFSYVLLYYVCFLLMSVFHVYNSHFFYFALMYHKNFTIKIRKHSKLVHTPVKVHLKCYARVLYYFICNNFSSVILKLLLFIFANFIMNELCSQDYHTQLIILSPFYCINNLNV